MAEKINLSIATLKAAIIDEKTRLTTVLRQTKVLTTILQNEQLKIWLNSELKGYSDESNVPDYRILPIQSFGIFAGRIGRIENAVIPVAGFPDDLKEFASLTKLINPAREIEELAKSGSNLRCRWSAENVSYARRYLSKSNGMELVDAWHALSPYVLEGVLEAARNRLLEFFLELEEVDPEIFSSAEATDRLKPDKVSQIFNYTINGGHNVIAAGRDIQQFTSSLIPLGNRELLIQEILRLGIPEAETHNLIEAAAADGSSQEKELGPKTRSWLGKATEKIAEGAWKTATTAAPQIIVKMLTQYWGW